MKTKFRTNSYFFLLLLIPVIIIAFILLAPTVRASIFPQSHQLQWQAFIKELSQKKRMDTKRFWQMREFYSPGHFVFKREGFAKKDVLFSQTKPFVFLLYNAPLFTSYESLVPESRTKEVLAQLPELAKDQKVLAHGDNFIIFQSATNKATIVFLANGGEMKQANGFFEYNEEDKGLVKGKSWLSISEVLLKK